MANLSNVGDLQDYLGRIQRKMDKLEERNDDLEGALGELSRVKVSENVTEDWLQMPFRFVDVAANATVILTQTVSGDGPFDLIEVTHTALDSSGNANDSFRFRVREGEAVGRSLTHDNSFVDAANASGTAQRPYIIKGRRRFRANIAIQVEVNNVLAGPATNTIEIVLHGIKVFSR